MYNIHLNSFGAICDLMDNNPDILLRESEGILWAVGRSDVIARLQETEVRVCVT